MRTVAGYRPFAELARGAAVVYKAYDPRQERTVLLKVLTPDAAQDPALVAWFEGEARAVSAVDHDNVVALFEAGRDDGRPFLAAEFVEGRSLAEVLAEGPLPPDLAAYVVASAARGLAAAHSRGLLHRDIKPSNVLLSASGQVKLADFGLATRVGVPEGDGAAGAGVRGTPGYLAPELVRGAHPGPAADIFALGAVLIESLTGRPAFPSSGAADALDVALHHDPVPALRADMRVPAELADIAAGLVAKAPSDRPATADAVAAALDRQSRLAGRLAGPTQLAAFLDDPAAYRATLPPLPGVVHPVRKARRLVPAALAILSLTAAISWYLLRDSRNPVEPPPAEATGGVTIGPIPSDEQVEDVPPPMPAADPLATARTGELVNRPQEPPDVAPEPVQTTDATADPPARPVPTSPSEPATGRLNIAVEPWAEVIVDGRQVGTTPLGGPLSLAAGVHRIELRNPDFPDHAVDVEVEAGETGRFAISLWSLVARVSVEVSPWAEVAINGRTVGTTPLRRAIVLPPGTHTLTFTHPSFGRREEHISVAAGETRTVRVRLAEGSP